MGIKKNADASYNLGLGVSDANDYKGFAGQNEITIQLTADGATDKSMDALNYLKTFAINQAAAGLPIKPSASVSISANGYTKALEADDFEITETGVKIGGIEYTASTNSWDFTNALVPSGGGGGGSDVFEINFSFEYNEQTQDDDLVGDKTNTEVYTAYAAGMVLYPILHFQDAYDLVLPIRQYVNQGANVCQFDFLILDTAASELMIEKVDWDSNSNKWVLDWSSYSLTPAGN